MLFCGSFLKDSRKKLDDFVECREAAFSVIPAEAGIQECPEGLDPGDPVPAKAGSRGDGEETC